MTKIHPFYLIGFILLALTSTACSMVEQVIEQAQQFTVSTEQINETATQAVEAAEVAVELAQQGGEILETLQNADIQLPTVDTEAIQAKVATIRPDENGVVTVAITDAELNQAFQETAVNVENQIAVSGATIAFQQNSAYLSGNITQPIVGTLNIQFVPYLSNNTAQFDVVAASFNDFPVPNLLIDQAEAMLNSTVAQAMSNLPTNVVLHSIVVSDGTITISGQQVQ